MTQSEVKELFEYKDGKLYSKVKRGKVVPGKEVGCINNGIRGGYMKAEIDGRKYQVHRLVFLMYHGYLPQWIDHKDGDKLNNRIENLRPATHFQNMANSKKPITNKSGYKGVCWHKRTGKWRSQISANNKKVYIGDFDTAELAHESYKKAALFYHREFANV